MKKLRISLIVTIITLSFLCSGLAVALNQDEATVHTFIPQTVQPGQVVTVTVAFTSNSSDVLQVTHVGLHFDWMPAERFVGVDLSSQPVTVPAGGTTMLPQMLIEIPANVTLGVYNYYIGIDGAQGASSTDFSWNSPPASITVIGSSGQTAGPTLTGAPTNGDGQNGQIDLQLYGAIVAVVVIVVLLVIVLVLRRKRAKPEPKPNQPVAEQEGSPPEQTPEHKPSSGQDFNI